MIVLFQSIRCSSSYFRNLFIHWYFVGFIWSIHPSFYKNSLSKLLLNITQAALKELWHAAFPGEELRGLVSEQWKEMGWQGKDPSTDFRYAHIILDHFGLLEPNLTILLLAAINLTYITSGVVVSYHWKICYTLRGTSRYVYFLPAFPIYIFPCIHIHGLYFSICGWKFVIKLKMSPYFGKV